MSVKLPRVVRASSFCPPPESELLEISDDDEEDENESPSQPAQQSQPAGDGYAQRPEALTEQDCSGDVVWHARILTDDFNNPKYILPSGKVKPRRAMPTIRESGLLQGLTKRGEKWILPGQLNDWPNLVDLELRSLTYKDPRILGLGRSNIVRIWNASDGTELPKKLPPRCRATFWGASWMKSGWSKESPGFVWWFVPSSLSSGGSLGVTGGERCLFGEKLIDTLQKGPHADAKAVRVHAFSHRYPVENETLRDRQTYHTGVLIEWSHGEFTSLIELAWLNGCGGYGGKSNWCEDKMEALPELYGAMPPSMKGAWQQDKSEIRVYDMNMKSREEFEAYLHKYSNNGSLPRNEWRFLEPKIYATADVRLRLCSTVHLAGCLLNYVQARWKYETLRANCQTFASDLYAFMAGDRDHKPFGVLVQAGYKQRTQKFLYKP